MWHHLAGVPAPVAGTAPAADHVLVVPAGRGCALPELAAAWFADVAWLREPVAPEPEAPRQRGLLRAVAQVAQAAQASRSAQAPAGTAPASDAVVPGTLRLGELHGMHGPFPFAAERAAALGVRELAGGAEAWTISPLDGARRPRGPRPGTYDDRDGIARAFAAGLPDPVELRAVQWAVAVARKLPAAVLADGGTLLAPDPHASVDLSLYSAHALDPAELTAQVRGLVATAEAELHGPGSGGGAAVCTVRARTPYDGELLVRVEHVDRVPRALGLLEWRLYGPFAYHVSWVPQEADELTTEHPSGLHLIARARMRAVVARLTAALQERVTGVVVDDGGFVATREELAARAEEGAGSARAWV